MDSFSSTGVTVAIIVCLMLPLAQPRRQDRLRRPDRDDDDCGGWHPAASPCWTRTHVCPPINGAALERRYQHGRAALYVDHGAGSPVPRRTAPRWPGSAAVQSRNATSLLVPWCLGVPVDRKHALNPEVLFKQFLLPQVPQAKAPLLLVDVGANRGQFALSVLASGHRSIAFEPSPSACAELKRAVALARAPEPTGSHAPGLAAAPTKPPGIDVHCVAVGAAAGSVRFASTNRSTASHVSAAGDTSGEVVRVVRLDDVVRQDERNFYLKTDTQGFEGDVLRGADRLLRAAAPRVLMIELSHGLLKRQGSGVVALIAQVRSYGYDCTFGNFFSAHRNKRGRVASTAVPMPRALDGKLTVSAEELAALLKRMPFTQMAGWTDLLCWAPVLEP